MSIIRTVASAGLPVGVIVQYLIVPSAPPVKQELLGWCIAILVMPATEKRERRT